MKNNNIVLIVAVSAIIGGAVGAVVSRLFPAPLPAEASFDRITAREADVALIDVEQLTSRDANGELFVHLQDGNLQVHRMIKAGELRGRVVLGQSLAACKDPISAPLTATEITAELGTSAQGSGVLVVRSPAATVRPDQQRPAAGQAISIGSDSNGIPTIYLQTFESEKTLVDFIYHPTLAAKARESAGAATAKPDKK